MFSKKNCMHQEHKSELFQRVVRQIAPRLPHPTTLNFEPEAWSNALKALKKPVVRDMDLAVSAIWIGQQIGALRETFLELFEGFSQHTAVQTMVAQANREFLVLRDKADRKMRRSARSSDAVHFEEMTQMLLRSGLTGQQQTPDSFIESLVDTLPHWFFHAWRRPTQKANLTDKEIGARGAQTIMSMSVEYVYRLLWQQSLWSGWRLERLDGRTTHVPGDRHQEENWLTWNIRQQALGLQSGFLDGVMLHGPEAPPPNVEPVLELSVVDLERRAGRKRVPIVGRPKKLGNRQRKHCGRWVAIRDSYLQPVLTRELPQLAQHKLTPEILFKSWCVLDDLVEVMIKELPRPELSTLQIMRRFALPIAQERLVSTVGKSLCIDEAAAAAIVDFLTADADDTTMLFNQGFWSTPLVPSPDGDNLYLLAPILSIANLSRCIENWLVRGGATDGLEPTGRFFERNVRVVLRTALKDNPDLDNTACPLSGLPTARDGEEIDALACFGDKVLMIEAKCFVSPSEPVDRYNFIGKLDEACAQAKRKSDWLDGRRELLESLFGWVAKKASTAVILPVVVTNQSFGSGYNSDGVPVVDLHYLSLLMGASSYMADTAVHVRTGSAAMERQHLYESQKDLEDRIENLLSEPVPLRRFKGTVSWRRERLPAWTEKDFGKLMPMMERPAYAGENPEVLTAIADREFRC